MPLPYRAGTATEYRRIPASSVPVGARIRCLDGSWGAVVRVSRQYAGSDLFVFLHLDRGTHSVPDGCLIDVIVPTPARA